MSTTSRVTLPSDLVLTPLLVEEVEKRVTAGLIEAVRAKMFYIHRKRGFSTGCDCSYCELKRQATFDLSTIRYAKAGEHWAYRGRLAKKYRKALALLEG